MSDTRSLHAPLLCFVCVKAEEITLTIGQAFNLAYRKFLESGGKDVETRKQIAGLQKRVSTRAGRVLCGVWRVVCVVWRERGDLTNHQAE